MIIIYIFVLIQIAFWMRDSFTVFTINHLPVAEGRGWEIIKRLPSHVYINLNISSIYKDTLTKFAGNVYGYENMFVQNFGHILNNKMAAIANCLKILKVL